MGQFYDDSPDLARIRRLQSKCWYIEWIPEPINIFAFSSEKNSESGMSFDGRLTDLSLSSTIGPG
jgi:hypothetical protein